MKVRTRRKRMMRHIGLHIGKKGQELGFWEVFKMLFSIGLVLLVAFVIVGRFYDIRLAVKVDENYRFTINLAQVLLSSDVLAKSTDQTVYRGIFNKRRVELIEAANCLTAFSEGCRYLSSLYLLAYPDYNYKIEIYDGSSIILDKCISLNCATCSLGSCYSGDEPSASETFPITLENSNGQKSMGKMKVGVEEARVSCSSEGGVTTCTLG